MYPYKRRSGPGALRRHPPPSMGTPGARGRPRGFQKPSKIDPAVTASLDSSCEPSWLGFGPHLGTQVGPFLPQTEVLLRSCSQDVFGCGCRPVLEPFWGRSWGPKCAQSVELSSILRFSSFCVGAAFGSSFGRVLGLCWEPNWAPKRFQEGSKTSQNYS